MEKADRTLTITTAIADALRIAANAAVMKREESEHHKGHYTNNILLEVEADGSAYAVATDGHMMIVALAGNMPDGPVKYNLPAAETKRYIGGGRVPKRPEIIKLELIAPASSAAAGLDPMPAEYACALDDEVMAYPARFPAWRRIIGPAYGDLQVAVQICGEADTAVFLARCKAAAAVSDAMHWNRLAEAASNIVLSCAGSDEPVVVEPLTLHTGDNGPISKCQLDTGVKGTRAFGSVAVHAPYIERCIRACGSGRNLVEILLLDDVAKHPLFFKGHEVQACTMPVRVE